MRARVVLLCAFFVGCSGAETQDDGVADAAADFGSDSAAEKDSGSGSESGESESGGDATIGDSAMADSAVGDTASSDSASSDSASSDSASSDTASSDSASSDTTSSDTAVADTATKDTGPVGPLTGGPCASGGAGVTAFRLRFTDSGGHAMTNYDVIGLPNKSGFKAAAYKNGSIDPSWYPPYDDMFLEVGGLRLDGSDFLDIDFSTVGIASISNATLWIYGRSFDTTTSGSFTWQTFEDVGTSDTMANSTPYQWYQGDATTAFAAGKASDLLRVKAGGPSGAIIVRMIELCMQAN